LFFLALFHNSVGKGTIWDQMAASSPLSTYSQPSLIRSLTLSRKGRTPSSTSAATTALPKNANRPPSSYVILDTPGQIEIFTWSASGAIITDAMASSFPAVVAYIIDTPRTMAPATFMSNMLYACRWGVYSLPRRKGSDGTLIHPASCTRPGSRLSWSSTRPMSSPTILRSSGCKILKRSRRR